MRERDINLLLDLQDDLFEVRRRSASLIKIGTIKKYLDGRLYEVEVDGCLVPSALKISGLAGTKGKLDLPYSPGDLVFCLIDSGDLSKTYLLGSPSIGSGSSENLYQIGFSDGPTISYDSSSKSLSITLESSQSLTVKGKGKVIFEGDVTVKGNITCKDVKTESGIALSKHKHSLDISKAITLTTDPDPLAEGGG